MVDAGIRGVKTYSYLVKEVGGAENVGFTRRDCQNFINKRKMNLIERGDAHTVMTHFKHQLAEDTLFFHSEKLDDDRLFAKKIWRDGRSKLDYDCFGDVVVFDTTYRTNRYNMIFAPFVKIHHHWKNILFGCAFLLDETTDAFIWLFETFLEAMGDKAPKTIFIDQSQAMANAIKKVFPNTCHRLCSWHISKNATQRLGSLYANNQFKGLFNRCLYNCETESEFESTWGEMIRRFNLADNKWLKGLYEIREKWCPAFSLHIFNGCMKSTQSSESMNNVLRKFSSKTMNLTEFVHHYEEQCEKMRLAEKDEDYRCKHGTPQIQVKGSKLLMQAADVYTVTIYNLFADEFISSLTVHLEELSNVGTLYSYRLFEEGHNRHHNVEFNSCDYSVKCSCKLFEFVGWLCRHILKVHNMWRITKIPAPYILNRWTKFAKKEFLMHGHDKSTTLRKSSLTIERNNLIQMTHHAINHLVLTDEGREVVRKKVAEMWEEAKRMENINNCKSIDDGAISNAHEIHCRNEELRVLDPRTVREKGVTNARKKSYLEKKKRKQKGGKKGLTTTQVPFRNDANCSAQNKSPNGECHSHYQATYTTPIHDQVCTF